MSELNNATNSEARLESILDQVRVLKAKYDERAEVTGENFNVFSILDRESDEVKTHSAIIAELLNPQGSHSQGTLFLQLFLEKLLADEIPKLKCGEDGLSDEYLKEFEVGVEVSFDRKLKEGKTERRRIDILIEKDDDCVVIENKIWAADQPEQLESYHEYATTKSGDPILIYLTPYGAEPGKYTLGSLSKNEVVCLSYYEHIIEWVGACIKEVARIPQIRETLHQYQILLKRLTGQPINWRDAMALKNILLKDENYNLIPDLEAAIGGAKTTLECLFWLELKKQLREFKPTFQVYHGKIGGDDNTEIIETDQLSEVEKLIEENRVQGRSFGLVFSLKQPLMDNSHEVRFQIENDKDDYPIYYSLVLWEGKSRKTGEDNKNHNLAKELEYLNEEDGWHANEKHGWLKYKYYSDIDFSSSGKLVGISENREQVVKKLVDEISDVIEKISGQKQGAVT